MKQQPVIKFEHVFIDFLQNPSGVYSIKDAITSWSHPFRKKTILKDISFEIKPGEHLGIAGRNGSGKSTLLRAIGGIIKPSKGRVQVNGKIAPILALGAGLELEMTGYENIRLLLSLNGHQVNHQIVSQWPLLHRANRFRRHTGQQNHVVFHEAAAAQQVCKDQPIDCGQ